jgi:hypothetical protein
VAGFFVVFEDFAFAKANNVEIANVLENWLVEKGLK